MYDITVIIPLYYGERYVDPLLKMIDENKKELEQGISIETIFVKDSMETFQKEHIFDEHTILVQNEKNLGIQGSRVRGLNMAQGKYIHMFDQDDKILPKFYYSQLKAIKDADVVVANGIKEYEGYNKYLYQYNFMQQTVKWEWFYLNFSCRILSPGQCLIKKKSIPDIWIKNPLKNNGADDFFLWLLLFEENKKFQINRERLYIHVNTGENLSLCQDKMDTSLQEVVDLALDTKCISEKKIRVIQNKQLKNNGGTLRNSLISIVEKLNKQ